MKDDNRSKTVSGVKSILKSIIQLLLAVGAGYGAGWIVETVVGPLPRSDVKFLFEFTALAGLMGSAGLLRLLIAPKLSSFEWAFLCAAGCFLAQAGTLLDPTLDLSGVELALVDVVPETVAGYLFAQWGASFKC